MFLGTAISNLKSEMPFMVPTCGRKRNRRGCNWSLIYALVWRYRSLQKTFILCVRSVQSVGFPCDLLVFDFLGRSTKIVESQVWRISSVSIDSAILAQGSSSSIFSATFESTNRSSQAPGTLWFFCSLVVSSICFPLNDWLSWRTCNSVGRRYVLP